MKMHISSALLLALSLRAGVSGASPLQTSGRTVLDGCGNVFVARGVEQILGKELPPGNDWVGQIRHIAEAGFNRCSSGCAICRR